MMSSRQGDSQDERERERSVCSLVYLVDEGHRVDLSRDDPVDPLWSSVRQTHFAISEPSWLAETAKSASSTLFLALPVSVAQGGAAVVARVRGPGVESWRDDKKVRAILEDHEKVGWLQDSLGCKTRLGSLMLAVGPTSPNLNTHTPASFMLDHLKMNLVSGNLGKTLHHPHLSSRLI